MALRAAGRACDLKSRCYPRDEKPAAGAAGGDHGRRRRRPGGFMTRQASPARHIRRCHSGPPAGPGFLKKTIVPSGRKARRRRRRRGSRPPQAPPGGALRRQASPDRHIRRWHWGPPAGAWVFEKTMLASGGKARRRRRRRRARPPQAPPGGALRRQASPEGACPTVALGAAGRACVFNRPNTTMTVAHCAAHPS